MSKIQIIYDEDDEILFNALMAMNKELEEGLNYNIDILKKSIKNDKHITLFRYRNFVVVKYEPNTNSRNKECCHGEVNVDRFTIIDLKKRIPGVFNIPVCAYYCNTCNMVIIIDKEMIKNTFVNNNDSDISDIRTAIYKFYKNEKSYIKK